MSEPIYDPNRRQRYAFRRDGENLFVEIWVEPGGSVPTHLHPSQEERFTVLDGRIRFKAGGRKLIAGPGDEAVVVPPGVKHSFENVGDGEGHLTAEVRPALNLQETLEDFAEAARAGLYTARGFPTGPRAAVRMAELLERHGDTTVVSFPPPLVQRILLRPLLRFAR
jgi:quercetin dioxygenase-like cupin family protein